MKSIAVLMTVHNRKYATMNCLTSLFEQDIEDAKITVYLTDDGCTDGTIESVKLVYPDVCVISGNGNLFWNRGMLEAWKEASKIDYDYYLWLNDDTILFNNSIIRLLNASFAFKDNSIIIGSTHDNNDSQLTTYGGVDKDEQLIKDVSTVQECYTFNGNIVLIPKNVYKVIGTNDPIYHHGAGDFDYGIRANKAGFVNIVAKGYFGTCDRHDGMQKWQDPKLSLFNRLTYLFRISGGINPIDVFKYYARHKSLLFAIRSFLVCMYRALFPKRLSK